MKGRTLAALILCGVAAVMILAGLLTSSWATMSRRRSSSSIGLSEVKSCYRGECRTRKFSEMRMRRDEDKILKAAGQGVFVFGLVNVLGLIACAVLLGLQNKASHIPSRIVLFTVIFGLLQGIGYVVIIIASAKGSLKPAPGMSFFLFQMGSIAGIVGAALGWARLQAAPAGFPGGGMPMPGGQAPQGMAAGYGQAPQGMAAGYGQAPQGQAPQGQAPQGQAPQGQAPQGQAPQGQAPQGQAPQGQAPQAYPCQGCGSPLRYIQEHQRYYCDRCQQWV